MEVIAPVLVMILKPDAVYENTYKRIETCHKSILKFAVRAKTT